MYKLIICTFQWCEIVAHMDSRRSRKYCVGMQVKETQKIEIFINFMIKIAAALQQYIFHQMYAINFPVDIFCTNIQVQIECRIQFLWSQQKKTHKTRKYLPLWWRSVLLLVMMWNDSCREHHRFNLPLLFLEHHWRRNFHQKILWHVHWLKYFRKSIVKLSDLNDRNLISEQLVSRDKKEEICCCSIISKLAYTSAFN